MSLPRPSRLALLALLLPAAAMAGEAAVPPLIGKGVDPLVVLNLTSLVASEADFLNAYDNIKQLSTMPPTLNSACLTNTACLNKIARDNNVEALILGQAAPAGSEYDFQLVLYDAPKNRIVRTVSFKLPNSPSAIADGMGPYVKEVVTGVAPVKTEARSLPVASSVDIYDEEDAGPSRPMVNRTIPTAGTSSGRPLADREDPEEIAARQAAEAAAARRRAEEEAARRAAEERAAAEARARAEAEARARAEAEARRRAEEEAAARRAAEARARAEAEARARAEAEARARAEAEAAAARARATARSAPPPAVDEDEDFANFSLSSSVTVVADSSPARALESEDEDLGPMSGSASRSSSTSSRSSPSSTTSRSGPSSRDLDELDGPGVRSSASRSSSTVSRSSTSSRDLDELDGPGVRSSASRSSSTASRSSTSSRNLDELDAPSSRSSSASRSGSASSARTSQGSSSGNARVEREPAASDSSVLLAGRLGFAPYQGLGFVTYGAEVGYLVSGGLALIGGVEAYSVQRTIPPENLDAGEPARQWNTILPLNLGLQYQMGQGKAQPYLGAEMLIVPGIVRNSTTPAMGGRGRVGANFFVSDTVALNLNGAVGFLGGKDLATIQEGMKNGAVAPQVSAGTVLFF